MQLHIRKFSIANFGNKEEENKDAVDFDQTRKNFCISDGSTESSYSGEWASLLVGNFIKNPFNTDQKKIDLRSWVGPMQKKWYEQVPWDKLSEKEDWYENKAQIGAQATFLGFVIEKDNSSLSAWSIGDSTLFIIRDEKLIKSFPIEKSEDIGTRPGLMFSISKKKHSEDDGLDYYICSNQDLLSMVGFELKKGDLIIATTDELAKWFLFKCEKGQAPWIDLQQIIAVDDLKHLIKLEIISNTMKNDDITMLVFEIP